ncbi:MAG: metallophosphoesterase [Acidobacteria bacterium]|nr:metallophosphoesterase [Acidobacteriota bacterium]
MTARPSHWTRLAPLFLFFLFPLAARTLRFGVIGDSGTGDRSQQAVARAMESHQQQQPWKFVLMLGDNVYESGNPDDFNRKFKQVYQPLRAAGVEFHATLGNHDRRHSKSRHGLAQVEDSAFGYVGRRDEYVYVPLPSSNGKALARFLCLNSDAWIEELENGRVPQTRLAQLRDWLQQSGQYRWNIVFFHHTLYSFVQKGFFGLHGHGPATELRQVLEPLFAEAKVDAVLSGHEHFYMKVRPQHGIHYFISGGAGRIRHGAELHHPQVEFAAETLHFMDFELSENELKYAAISDRGEVIHSGTILK